MENGHHGNIPACIYRSHTFKPCSSLTLVWSSCQSSVTVCHSFQWEAVSRSVDLSYWPDSNLKNLTIIKYTSRRTSLTYTRFGIYFLYPTVTGSKPRDTCISPFISMGYWQSFRFFCLWPFLLIIFKLEKWNHWIHLPQDLTNIWLVPELEFTFDFQQFLAAKPRDSRMSPFISMGYCRSCRVFCLWPFLLTGFKLEK